MHLCMYVCMYVCVCCMGVFFLFVAFKLLRSYHVGAYL